MSFNNSRDVYIQGGAHNVVYGHQISNVSPDTTLQFLASRAAGNALHDSGQRYPPPNCHPGTRRKVLDTLSSWIEGDTKNTRVYWVYGAAGVGKSAIAQNLAEKYADSRLAAAFFFSRNDSTRDKLVPFVATITYQICTSDTLREILGSSIIETIASCPNIFDTTVEKQFQKLLLDPLCKAEPSGEYLANLIIVDGLDECVDTQSQERLLAIIGHAIACPTIIPLIFLVVSRPEPQIRHGFRAKVFASMLERFEIRSSTRTTWNSGPSPEDHDIWRYLLDQFTVLRTKYRAALRHEEALWPGKDVIHELVWRACGQFIFASTVIKYIDTRDELPQERLKTILRIHVDPEGHFDSPYPDLDLLYRQVVSTCRHWDKVQRILRLLVTRHSNHFTTNETMSTDVWRFPSTIAGILQLATGAVETLLSRLHSVLFIPNSGNVLLPVRILHASFTEFLLDGTRSGDYHCPEIPLAEYQNLIVMFQLRTFSSLGPYYPLYRGPEQSFSAAFSIWQRKVRAIYPISRLWILYCTSVDSPSSELLAELDMFDPYPVVSMLTMHNIVGLGHWRALLSWVESLGKQTPKKLVEKLESIFTGCCIWFSPNSSRKAVVWATVEFEQSLVIQSWESSALWHALIKELCSVPLGYVPQWHLSMVVGPSATTCAVPPEGWVAVEITKRNSEILQTICGDKGVYPFMLDDIKHDRWETVKRGLMKRGDLNYVKSVLYARRQEIAVLG